MLHASGRATRERNPASGWAETMTHQTGTLVDDLSFPHRVLESSQPTLVLFTADGCPPCEFLARRLPALAPEGEPFVGVVRCPQLDARFSLFLRQALRGSTIFRACRIAGVVAVGLFLIGNPALPSTGSDGYGLMRELGVDFLVPFLASWYCLTRAPLSREVSHPGGLP